MPRKSVVILEKNILLATEIDFAIGDALDNCDIHNVQSISEALDVAQRNGTATIEGRVNSVAIIDHAAVRDDGEGNVKGLMERFDAIVLAGWPDGNTPTDGRIIARLAKPFSLESVILILRQAFANDSRLAASRDD